MVIGNLIQYRHAGRGMILKVARLGNPVLRMKARPVPVDQIRLDGLQAFIQSLLETMREYDGVGIAAPQAHVSSRIAVIQVDHNPRYPRAPKIPLTVLINPRLRPISRAVERDWEGCLSVEGLRGVVARWREVEVRAYNGRGVPVRFRARGFFARVIQHEVDHLEGKVFLDRMKDLRTLTHLTEYARYWTKRSRGQSR